MNKKEKLYYVIFKNAGGTFSAHGYVSAGLEIEGRVSTIGTWDTYEEAKKKILSDGHVVVETTPIETTYLRNATAEDATHVVRCRQCQGGNCREYTMPCVVLGKPTKSGKVRVLVFGYRTSGRTNEKRVRYVDVENLMEK